MNFIPLLPLGNQLVEAVMKGITPIREPAPISTPAPVFDGARIHAIKHDNSRKARELREELAKYRAQHAELLTRFDALINELKRKKIESFEELQKQDQDAKKVLVKLAQRTEPAKLPGINIALFGLTSTGKSTMLNALLGQNVAETGVGETTIEIKAYNGTSFTLWDVPGRNDEVSYLSMEYVSFFKSLTRRLILIQATVKENSSIMKLLDELELPYDIIFSKFDKVDVHEQTLVKKKIRDEIRSLGLTQKKNVFFLSARHPKMFRDWLTMVDYLTKECGQYDQHTMIDTDSDSSTSSDSDSSTTSDSD